ncbi:MAG: sigma-54-dependent transcriptional regulator [Polyangiaceae bacterium]
MADAGHNVTGASDGAEAADLLSTRVFDLAICDVQMPRLGGMALLRRIRRDAPGTVVVLMTAFGMIPDVVDSLRDGAVDYVTKPFDPHEFAKRVVEPIDEHRALKRKFDEASRALVGRKTGSLIVATSPVMRRLVGRMDALAHNDTPIVITGDRGTGKELVARTIHAQGPRREGRFVVIDAVLLEDLLLAPRPTDGVHDAWLHDALGGTLAIDGVERLSLAAQASLARHLGSAKVVARTGTAGMPLGARLVTLTRKTFAGSSHASDLLESLYYQLNGIQLHVPSLVDRSADLCELVTLLLHELGRPGTTAPGIAPAAWAALSTHDYPGNVRELRRILEHAMALCDGGPIEPRHLPAELLARET